MDKKILALLLGILFSFTLDAKEKVLGQKVPGQIVYSQKIVEVTFLMPSDKLSRNYMAIQKKVKYIGANGKIKEVTAEQAKEIRFTFDDVDVRMVSLKRPGRSSKKLFLKLETDGYLKMYSHSYSKTVGYQSYITEMYLFQKGNEDPILAVASKFRKKMKAYFSDCPALVKKIDRWELTRGHLPEIVEYYNNNCR